MYDGWNVAITLFLAEESRAAGRRQTYRGDIYMYVSVLVLSVLWELTRQHSCTVYYCHSPLLLPTHSRTTPLHSYTYSGNCSGSAEPFLPSVG